MTKIDGCTVNAPLVITSRLMAGYVIDGAGTLHLKPSHRDGEGRVVYDWAIDDADGKELASGHDLSSGVGQDVDVTRMMVAFVGYLEAAAEAYSHNMRHGEGHSENSDIFPGPVMEWAYGNSDELTMVRVDLGDDED